MITLTSAGLAIDTFDVILSEIQTAFRTAFGVSISTSPSSAAGQLQRLLAHREETFQQLLLRAYQNLDPRLAEGVHLAQRNSLLGVTQLGAQYAEVVGTATCSGSCTINNGFRVSVGGYVFEVAEGPYSIVGAGTIPGIQLVAQQLGEVDVSVLGAWTLVDSVSGFTSFDDTSQPVLGRLLETDTEYRARAERERYRRGSGPLAAIEAAVSRVTGVTYVRAWENVDTDPVDTDGIPYHAINVVVQGGDDTEVAEAIRDSMPAGHLAYGTSVSEIVTSGAETKTVSFDRVTSVNLWVRATLTTSTSEEVAPDDLESLVETTLLAYTAENWDIGSDVLPFRLSGALAGIVGVDGILIETSLDGASYNTSKRTISLRQQAILALARITVVEA
jgi:uncharacterized phage protein gp47/JayE